MKLKISILIGLAAVTALLFVVLRRADKRIPTSLVGPNASPLVKAVVAGRVSEVERLVKQHADPNVRVDSQTALMFAWLSPGTDVVKLLVQSKADLNATDSRGLSALMIATSSGRPDVAIALADAGADVQIRDRQDRTALSLAAELSPDVDLIRHLLLHGAILEQRSGQYRSTPLMLAAASGHEEVVTALLDAKADINARDARGESAVFYAVALNRPSTLGALIDRGADLGATGERGSVAQLALSPGRDDCVELLRKSGVEIPKPNPAVHVGR